MSFFKKLFGSSKKKGISSNDDKLKEDNLFDKSKSPTNNKSNTKPQVVEKDVLKENQADISLGKSDKNASYIKKSSEFKNEKVANKKSTHKK
jgi:hypothetical protein